MTNTNWKNIWSRKAQSDESDKLLINGWEKTEVNMGDVSSQLKEIISLKLDDKVLEVGCGSGALSEHFITSCDYVACDYADSMVETYKKLTSPACHVCEAENLPFDDNSFDKVIVFSVFQYFPNYEYAEACINELKRVSKKSVFIGDLAYESHDDSHLLFTEEQFSDWKIFPGFVEGRPRFNIYREF